MYVYMQLNLGQFKNVPINPENMSWYITPLFEAFSILTWSHGLSRTITVLLIWINGFPLYPLEDTWSLPTAFLLTFICNQIPGWDKESTTNM